MKYYVHAYADAERRLPDKEDIIEAENDDAAYSKAWDKYAEHKEVYVERAYSIFDLEKKFLSGYIPKHRKKRDREEQKC